MTTMDNTHRHPELDALTDSLPAAATQLVRRLDRVLAAVTASPRPYLDEHGQLRVAGDIVCPICLGAPCDCLIDHDPAALAAALAIRRLPSSPPADCCPVCSEGRGWCQSTGGQHPCEGVDEFAGDTAKTPYLPPPDARRTVRKGV